MELGCGIRVKPVKGREYLYVWHYEPVDGRRRQRYEYVGPVNNPAARRAAVDKLEGYARKAIEDARRRVQTERAIASPAGR